MSLLARAQQASNAKAQNLNQAGVGKAARDPAQGTGIAALDQRMTPEETKAYNAALDVASKLLYQNQDVSQKVAGLLQSGQPAQAIGDTAAMLTKQTDDSMQGKIPETVIIPLGVHLVGEIADFGEELKVIQTDAPMLKQALQLCIKRLLTDYGVDENSLQLSQQLAQQFSKSADFQKALSEVGQDSQQTSPAPAGPPQGQQPAGAPPAQPAPQDPSAQQQSAPQPSDPAMEGAQ